VSPTEVERVFRDNKVFGRFLYPHIFDAIVSEVVIDKSLTLANSSNNSKKIRKLRFTSGKIQTAEEICSKNFFSKRAPAEAYNVSLRPRSGVSGQRVTVDSSNINSSSNSTLMPPPAPSASSNSKAWTKNRLPQPSSR